jgi:putative membrane protein
MKSRLIRTIVMALSILGASFLCKAIGLGFEARVESVKDFLILLLGAIILGFLNGTIGRLLKFLTIPLNCLTFGLFALVINAGVLLAAAKLKFGFWIDEAQPMRGFFAAFVASALISIMSGLLGTLVSDDS